MHEERFHSALRATDRPRTHRHFGRAADSLSMSQPALSRSIQSLERNLGYTLFRTASHGRRRPERRVADPPRPSHPGRHSRTPVRILRAGGPGPVQVVHRLWSLPGGADRPGALSELDAEPAHRCRSTWKSRTGFASPELLESGVCDLAITELSAAGKSTELASELLNDRALHMVVRNGHPLLRLEHPGLDDILAYPWVCSHIPARVATLFGAAPVAAGDLEPRPATSFRRSSRRRCLRPSNWSGKTISSALPRRPWPGRTCSVANCPWCRSGPTGCISTTASCGRRDDPCRPWPGHSWNWSGRPRFAWRTRSRPCTRRWGICPWSCTSRWTCPRCTSP